MDKQPQNYHDPNRSNDIPYEAQLTPNMNLSSQQSLASQSSLNAYQQMQYTQEAPKKRKLNSLMITLLVVVLLLVVVGVAMIVISGQKRPAVVVQDKPFTDSNEKELPVATPADSAEQSSKSPNVSDASLVVQNFYDDLLSAMKTGSSKQYQENFRAYIKDNQNLTANFQARLIKTKVNNTNPIMFDLEKLPSKIQYDDPALSPKDDWVAMQRVILDFGNKERVALVTLKWVNSVTQAGFWQIDDITQAK